MIKYLIRILYPIVLRILRIYWFIFRPKTRGARCMIRFEDKILFIKHSYGSGFWNIPGGGTKKKETFEQAAIREVKEEVGIVVKEVKKVGSHLSDKEYKIDQTELFLADVDSEYYKIDNIEIIEARWARLDEIPEPHGLNLGEMLKHIK